MTAHIHPSIPSQAPPRVSIWIARVLWGAVAMLVATIFVAMLPTHLTQVRFHWSVQEAMGAVTRWGPFAAYVLLVATVRLLVGGVYAVAGLVIFWRRSDDPFAVFVSATLIMLALPFGLNGNLSMWRLPPPLMALAPWLPTLLAAATLACFVLLLFLIPNGRFIPRRIRWMALFLVALLATVVVVFLSPTVARLLASLWQAAGIAPDEASWLLLSWTLLVGFLSGLVAQVYRYRRETDPLRRQQTKWVAWGLSAPLLALLLTLLLDWIIPEQSLYHAIENLLSPLVLTLIPLSILFSILRYRLWEIDLLLNRALVYGVLTVAIVAAYILLVGILSMFFHGSNLWLSVLATGMIALLFQPLRQAMQQLVNRLLYGERDDPATVLARLGQRLEGVMAADAMLPTLVETVAQALKLPYVAVAIQQDDDAEEVVAEHGLRPLQVAEFPLLYQGELLGRLDAAPRAIGETLTAGDRRLLHDIAHQAGPAIHAMLLTADLQRSRARLVTAREEERRRLRRDLHDGLGPQLATLAMQIDAARNLLPSDPGQADQLLQDGKRQMQEALTGIRRLVYDLRPPALDQLGLVSALRDYAAGQGATGLQVSVDAPEPLPPLPAAVEVAAYRIALEALTNVIRHAQAQRCWIRLRVGDGLHLEIEDDGRGLAPDVRHGVGITAMVERAAELGGVCKVQPGSGGGTLVQAWLPVVAVQTDGADG
jgi:signal transduction histidine kinase